MTTPAPAASPDDRRTLLRGLALLGMAIRSQPRPFAVAVAGSALYAGAIVAAAVVLGEVTDRVILPAFSAGQATAAALATVGGLIVGVGVAKSAGIVLRRVGAAYMQYRLHATYRREVTRRYQRLPLTWHRRHSTGELLSNANADVEAAFAPIAMLPFAVGVAVLLVATAGTLLLTDVYVAVVGGLVVPAMVVVNVRYNMRIKGPATRAQQHKADVSAVAHESFEGALVVKTLGREHEETERFAGASDDLRDELIQVGRLRALFDPAVEALPQVAVLLVLLVGAWRIAGGALDAGELVRSAYLFTLLSFPLRIVGFLLGELPRAVVGWERVERVLAATGELVYGDRDPPGDDRGAAVAVRAVAYRYADSPVLAGVSLAAAPGRTIALVGATGSGKSTVASLLVRLVDPDSGEVILDGGDVRCLTRAALPRHVAIVFQQSFLFDDTVWGNITLGEPFAADDVETAARLAQAHEFITALPAGYRTPVGEGGATLSGGQRQRIALARALVRRPRLLVLDDATSSVDTTVERAILAGLRAADLPSTTIVVAYRRATVELADEVIFVDEGRVRARGRHEELLRREPAYGRLLAVQQPRPGQARS